MIKKIVAALVVLAVVVLAGWKLFFNKSDISKKIQNISENLTSYHMEATMEIAVADEDSKNYFVITDYLKKGENDLFRISILDKSINQEQVILKNNDGVYVLTPTLNQVYKFKGDYPLNSPKPYLYHSIIDVFKGKHEIKNLDDGYLVSAQPTYENNPTWVKEDIKMSKDLKPVWVNIYNADNSIVVKVNFTKVDMKPTYNDTFFELNENMKNARETSAVIQSSKIEDLPFLPATTPVSATLKEQTMATVDGETMYILTYDGNKPFTVVQSIIAESTETELIEVDGSIVENVFGITYINGNNLTYIYNTVRYQIYSKVLTVSEMVSVASSMEQVMFKE